MNGGLIIAGIIIGFFGLITIWIPFIGIGLMVLGFILFIVGLVSPSQQQQQQQIVVNPPIQQQIPHDKSAVH